MTTYILAFDQGTTSSRAIVFNKKSEVVAVAQKEFKQIFPQAGWVEHDAAEIWYTQLSVATEAVIRAGLMLTDIAAIGITNQRETTVVWNRKTGEPIYHAIVWQDKRTAAYCDELRAAGKHKLIQERTGLILDAYFSATKLKWILDHVEGAREQAARGELCFGTIDSWLIWKLTNGTVHATDVSNASRTMLYNIHTLQWDAELLSLFDIPSSVLPEVRSSSEVFGHTQEVLTGLHIPIAGVAGDQQSALFGQMCLYPGMVKNTYGTGCFMLMNTGTKPISSHNNLVTTIAWKINDTVHYALEGSVFIAGAVVQWLRDGLGIIKKSGDIEALADSVADNGGVYMVPAFAGLGAPYWNQHAKGTIVGITRGTTAGHIGRAAVESIAYQTMDVLAAMEADAGVKIKELRVDGGATINNKLLQFQSDLLRTTVIRPVITETTALGAAYLAGLAVKYWSGIEEIEKYWQADHRFNPQMPQAEAEQKANHWKQAVQAAASYVPGKG
jgi:glycerol kinase